MRMTVSCVELLNEIVNKKYQLEIYLWKFIGFNCLGAQRWTFLLILILKYPLNRS